MVKKMRCKQCNNSIDGLGVAVDDGKNYSLFCNWGCLHEFCLDTVK